MVATVLRLRYRSLGNTLARNPWQLVGFCFGILWALSILAAVAVAMGGVALTQGPPVAYVVAVLGGSALLLGWVLGPVLVAGTDATIDAARLAPFPLSRRQTMLALTAAGLTGIPGIATALASLTTIVLWLRWPAAAAVAVPAIAIAVLTCVVSSRLVTTLSTGLGGNRRAREVIGTLVLAVVIMTGPILTGVLTLLSGAGGIADRLLQAADVLGWTPLGAAWAAPAAAADGAWGAAAARLAIAAGTLAVLWLLWDRAMEASVASPPRQTARALKPGSLGWFGRMPTGAVGATWARSLTGWLRDPRYLRQLLVVPLFPALFAFTTGVHGVMFAASAAFVALILSIASYSDISYDGTAFATVLSSGGRGRDDRLGRVLGAACIGIPLVVLVALVSAFLSGTVVHLPALLGASLGILLAGYGVTAISSALIVTPVAAPGDSPFRSVPGQTFVGGLLVFVVMGAILVVSAPSVVLASIAVNVAADAGSAALSWWALAVGVCGGAVAVTAGVIAGGRVLDRTGPELLQRIKAFPTS